MSGLTVMLGLAFGLIVVLLAVGILAGLAWSVRDYSASEQDPIWLADLDVRNSTPGVRK